MALSNYEECGETYSHDEAENLEESKIELPDDSKIYSPSCCGEPVVIAFDGGKFSMKQALAGGRQ